MGDYLVGAILLLAIPVVIVVSIAYSRAEKRRRAEIWEMAKSLGFAFHPASNPGCLVSFSFAGPPVHDPTNALRHFRQFEFFNCGDSPQVGLVVTGKRSGAEWFLFDYQYSTGSGDDRTVHNFTIVGAVVPFCFPALSMRPETAGDRIGKALGRRDIEFESAEFNALYHVQCAEPRAAYDILHPQMIAYLLAVPPATLHFAGPSFITVLGGRADALSMRHAVMRMEAILERIPEYVREDRKFGT